MKSKKKHRIQNIVTILIVTIFFSCKDNFDAIQQIGMFANAPAGEADDINLKYTDSSQLVANLLSPKMLDYSNRSFGFSEFPEGIELIIYDKNNNKSKVFADYAIYYDETGLIELQDNVIIATHNGDSLFYLSVVLRSEEGVGVHQQTLSAPHQLFRHQWAWI